MARNRANESSKEGKNKHAGRTVHVHEAHTSSSGSNKTDNSWSFLSKQSANWTESTNKTDSDFSHTRVRFLLDANSSMKGQTLYRDNTHLTKEDLDNLTFRPQINDKRIINKTYTGEDTHYMALESARFKKGSSDLERDNLYRSVQHIPLYKRKNYMLGRPQAEQYRYIQDIYGKDNKDKRARQFFEKLEDLQKEDFRKRLEELIEREKMKMETKERQRDQLAYLRQKFENDAWRRFMTQYVTSRVLAHEHVNRHVYGLPEDLEGEPEFEAKLKRKRLLPKTDTDSASLSKRNKKKYQQLFDVKTGPTWQTNDRPPKLEGIDSVYFEDEDEKEIMDIAVGLEKLNSNSKPRTKRRNVNEILQEAQAMLQMAEEELNDSLQLSSLENDSKRTTSFPRTNVTDSAQMSRRSTSPDQFVHRSSLKIKTTEKKDRPRNAEKRFASYPLDTAVSNSPSRMKGGRSGLLYANENQQKHSVTGRVNHKSYDLSPIVRKKNGKTESPPPSSHDSVNQPKSIENVKVNGELDTDKRESNQTFSNMKQQDKGSLKHNDSQPERDETLSTKTQLIENRTDYVSRENDANPRISSTTRRKHKQIDSASHELKTRGRHSPTMSFPKEEVQLTYLKYPASGAISMSSHDHQQKQHSSTTEYSEEDARGKQVAEKIITTKNVNTKEEPKPTTDRNVPKMEKNYSNTGKIQSKIDSNKKGGDMSHFNKNEQESSRFNHPTIHHNSHDSHETVDRKPISHVQPRTYDKDELDRTIGTIVTRTSTKNVPKESNKAKNNQKVNEKVGIRNETINDNGKDYNKLSPSKRTSKIVTADIKNFQKESESKKSSKVDKSVTKTKAPGLSRTKLTDKVKAEDKPTREKDWQITLEKFLSQPVTGTYRTDEQSLLSAKLNDDDDDDDDDDMSDIFERARKKYNLDIDGDDDD